MLSEEFKRALEKPLGGMGFAFSSSLFGLAADPSWEGLARGMLVLAALWWAWAAYAWLTNYIAAEEDRERLLMLAVMGAFLITALAAPEAFGEHALEFSIDNRVTYWCESCQR